MSLSDYAQWNEEAQHIWWEEEGKHHDADAENAHEDQMTAADAYAEELGELTDEELLELSGDNEHLARWPQKRPLIDWELKYRGLKGAEDRDVARPEQSRDARA